MTIFNFANLMGLILLSNGLALAVDYDRKSLFDIQTGRGRLAFSDIVKKAKDFIANYDAILASANKINSAVYCFRSKNFYGMKDVQEIQAVGVNQGDIPNNSENMVATLPEAPEQEPIEIESQK